MTDQRQFVRIDLRLSASVKILTNFSFPRPHSGVLLNCFYHPCTSYCIQPTLKLYHRPGRSRITLTGNSAIVEANDRLATCVILDGVTLHVPACLCECVSKHPQSVQSDYQARSAFCCATSSQRSAHCTIAQTVVLPPYAPLSDTLGLPEHPMRSEELPPSVCFVF